MDMGDPKPFTHTECTTQWVMTKILDGLSLCIDIFMLNENELVNVIGTQNLVNHFGLQRLARKVAN
jgi:hypothetical protein